MKVWKKLSAVALALMMVLALCVMASAEETAPPQATLESGVAKNTTTTNAAIANTLTIPKAITVTGNTALSAVYGPAVTYKYDIAPATISSITVNDGTNSGPVRAGVTDGVTLTDAVFTSSTVSLGSGTGTATANVTATVDLSKFSIPGVYRYAITENSANATALLAAGVNQAAADTLYLDVYIKNGESGLVVYGFVLLKDNTSIASTDNPTHKVSSFTTDSYKTFDVTLTKKVEGDAGDKTNQFPFAIAVANGTAGGYYTRKGTTDTPAAQTETSVNTTLADSEIFYIYGLNPRATVTYTERNNTIDVYTVTAKDNNEATVTLTGTFTATTGSVATSALAVSNYSAVATEPTATNNSAITFTNTLNAISPTGVALRYAPYLAMLGAGVVALPLSRRKKEEEL